MNDGTSHGAEWSGSFSGDGGERELTRGNGKWYAAIETREKSKRKEG